MEALDSFRQILGKVASAHELAEDWEAPLRATPKKRFQAEGGVNSCPSSLACFGTPPGALGLIDQPLFILARPIVDQHCS